MANLWARLLTTVENLARTAIGLFLDLFNLG